MVPLTRQQRMSMTPENVKELTQEKVDQLYGRLTAGPIPDGQYAGDLFFSRGDGISGDGDGSTRLQEILGGLAGRAAGAASTFWRSSAANCGRARCSSATSACCAT